MCSPPCSVHSQPAQPLTLNKLGLVPGAPLSRPSQTLSQSPTKLMSMEVGEPCDTAVLAAPCPDFTH